MDTQQSGDAQLEPVQMLRTESYPRDQGAQMYSPQNSQTDLDIKMEPYDLSISASNSKQSDNNNDIVNTYYVQREPVSHVNVKTEDEGNGDKDHSSNHPDPLVLVVRETTDQEKDNRRTEQEDILLRESVLLPKRYSCFVCDEEFTTKEQLKSHMRVHSLFSCNYCMKTFTNEKACMSHRTKCSQNAKCSDSQELQNNSFEEFSEESISTRSDINQPPRKKVKSNQFSCSQCYKSFISRYRLNKHMNTHRKSPKLSVKGKGKKFTCDECHEQFASKYYLNKHLLDHQTTTTEESLIKSSSAMCEKTSSSTSQPQKQDKQNRTVTKEVHPVLTCALCQKTFTDKKNYIIHVSQHSDEMKDPENETKDPDNETNDSDSETDTDLPQNEVSEEDAEWTPEHFCDTCNKEFSSRYHLQQHLNVAHVSAVSEEQLKYKCTKCERKFVSRKSRASHMGLVHKLSHACKFCDKVFESKEELDAHRLEEKFPCQQCGKVLKTYNSYWVHSKQHGRESKRPHSCDTCQKEFPTLRSLQTHSTIHSAERPHMCEICGKKFRLKSLLQSHLRTHLEERPYKCDVCGKAFKQKGHLSDHAGIHHEPQHVCEVCGKAFNSRKGLREHRRIHSDERPYCCETCGKCFQRLQALRLHDAVHTKEKNYLCSICGARLSSPSTLHKHKRTHKADKKHKCSVCGKGFIDMQHLKQHTVIHMPEKPYKCDICGKGFPQKPYVKIHQRKVHPEHVSGGIRTAPEPKRPVPQHKNNKDVPPPNFQQAQESVVSQQYHREQDSAFTQQYQKQSNNVSALAPQYHNPQSNVVFPPQMQYQDCLFSPQYQIL